MRGYSKYGVSLRHIKTTQEIRSNIDCEYVRAKRRNLPNAYDDIIASGRIRKSWKKIRKNQYREDAKDLCWHTIQLIGHKYNFHYIKMYSHIFERCDKFGYYNEIYYDKDKKSYFIRWYGKDIA